MSKGSTPKSGRRKAEPSEKRRAAQEERRRKQANAERRLSKIVDLMLNGLWIPGRSGRLIAQEENISVSTVESQAAEASRIIRRAVGADAAEIRARILSAIDDVRVRARQSKRTVFRKTWVQAKGMPRQLIEEPVEVTEEDHQAELRALELYARLVPGVMPQRLEISGPEGGPVEVEHGVVLLPAKQIVEVQEEEMLPPKVLRRLNGKGDGT